MILIIVFSFSNNKYGSSWEGFTLKWYAKAFSEEKYLLSFRYSLLVASFTVLFSSIIGTLAAYGTMRSDFRGKNLINAFVLSPLIFPMLIIGIALLQFYSLLKVSGSFFGCGSGAAF